MSACIAPLLKLTFRSSELTAGLFICKFQNGMKVIMFINKLSELFFSMSPNKKYIVNITDGAKGKVKKLCLYFIHEDASIRKWKFCANSRSRFLSFDFAVELKKVISQNKICHSYYILSRYFRRIPFNESFSKCF